MSASRTVVLFMEMLYAIFGWERYEWPHEQQKLRSKDPAFYTLLSSMYFGGGIDVKRKTLLVDFGIDPL